MMEIPEMTRLDVVFGNVGHLPAYDDLPDDFKRNRSNPYCAAIRHWFFNGAGGSPEKLEVNGKTFTPKPGVEGFKAIAAINAAMKSFEPKHEHKEAGCAFMLAEWFDAESAV